MSDKNNINELAIVKNDYKLANGKILSVGVNFRSLQLMTTYKGGFKQLQEDMNEDNDDLNTKMNACGHILYSLIRSAGEEITADEAMMLIGIEDIDKLFEIFEDYSLAMDKMQKKTTLKQKKLKKLNGQS